MRTHSTIIITLAAAAVVGLIPSAAAGSPLLSGYGGPGTGEQQLVVGSLVGGGSGRGSGGGPGSGASSVASGQGGRTSAVSSGAEGPGHGVVGSKARSPERRLSDAGGAGGSASAKSPGGGSSGGGPARDSDTAGSATAHEVAVASTTLGLSSAQLLTIALIAFAVFAIAAATRWLAGLERNGAAADTKAMNIGGGH